MPVREWTCQQKSKQEKRASFLLLHPLCRLPAEGVVQIKGGSSHLEISVLKMCQKIWNFSLQMSTQLLEFQLILYAVKLTTKNSHHIIFICYLLCAYLLIRILRKLTILPVVQLSERNPDSSDLANKNIDQNMEFKK